MGKLMNNPMMKGASGMVGNTIVFRQWRGRLIVANRPRPSKRLPSASQLEVREKFTTAAAYARIALADPAKRALYETGIGGTKYTAQNVAMSDYLNAPQVYDIDTSSYKGVAGDEILIKAVDDFKVTKVIVEIKDAAGITLEIGEAVEDPIAGRLWIYTTSIANSLLTGTTVQATAFDIPRNKGTLKKQL